MTGQDSPVPLYHDGWALFCFKHWKSQLVLCKCPAGRRQEIGPYRQPDVSSSTRRLPNKGRNNAHDHNIFCCDSLIYSISPPDLTQCTAWQMMCLTLSDPVAGTRLHAAFSGSLSPLQTVLASIMYNFVNIKTWVLGSCRPLSGALMIHHKRLAPLQAPCPGAVPIWRTLGCWRACLVQSLWSPLPRVVHSTLVS